MDKTDRLRDYGLAFLLYEQSLGICGYELIRELFIFIKLILNSYLVSDFRAKGDDFVAVIVHEFGHGFFGLRHCLDTNCIMCDYQKHKGKPFSFNLCKEHEGIR